MFNNHTKLENIIIGFVILSVILAFPTNIYANNSEWIEVPKTEFGRQFWDKNSVKQMDGNKISILSRYISTNPKVKKESSTYLMSIDCKNKLYKDEVKDGVNVKKPTWKESNGDSLIDKVIEES